MESTDDINLINFLTQDDKRLLLEKIRSSRDTLVTFTPKESFEIIIDEELRQLYNSIYDEQLHDNHPLTEAAMSYINQNHYLSELFSQALATDADDDNDTDGRTGGGKNGAKKPKGYKKPVPGEGPRSTHMKLGHGVKSKVRKSRKRRTRSKARRSKARRSKARKSRQRRTRSKARKSRQRRT